MNTEELFKSLTPEQSTAMLAFRDEMLAANSAQNLELIAAKDEEKAKLQTQLDDTTARAVVAEQLALLTDDEKRKSEKQRAIDVTQAKYDEIKAELDALKA